MNATFRHHFPSLQRQNNGKPFIFLDGPGGTQVPNAVIDAISDYYRQSNANTHGTFLFSQETDQVMDTARHKMAHLLGAEGPHTISFGQNMTTLNFALSQAMAQIWQPGDEVLITQLDHEANRGPWLSLRKQGITVKEIPLLSTGTLDYNALERMLNDRTRLVAIGYSSNIIGTVNDLTLVRKLTHHTGAWLLVDGVHGTPHFSIDVQQMGCDFFLCSAYKFYGPHVGLLYTKPGLLDQLPINRLRTADQHAPFVIETGTLNHAAIAGVSAAIDFISHLGHGEGEREKLVSAMRIIEGHERQLANKLYRELRTIPGLEIYGLPTDVPNRAPTLSFSLEGHHPTKICQQLAKGNIFAWDGHFYALRATEVLGLAEKGGVVRMGISAYTNEEDIDETITLMKEIAME